MSLSDSGLTAFSVRGLLFCCCFVCLQSGVFLSSHIFECVFVCESLIVQYELYSLLHRKNIFLLMIILRVLFRLSLKERVKLSHWSWKQSDGWLLMENSLMVVSVYIWCISGNFPVPFPYTVCQCELTTTLWRKFCNFANLELLLYHLGWVLGIQEGIKSCLPFLSQSLCSQIC